MLKYFIEKAITFFLLETLRKLDYVSTDLYSGAIQFSRHCNKGLKSCSMLGTVGVRKTRLSKSQPGLQQKTAEDDIVRYRENYCTPYWFLVYFVRLTPVMYDFYMQELRLTGHTIIRLHTVTFDFFFYNSQ